jgi:hypothetical protein
MNNSRKRHTINTYIYIYINRERERKKPNKLPDSNQDQITMQIGFSKEL